MDAYKFRQWYIPPHMLEAVEEYVKHGRPPGDFLRAVLENDLMRACGRADDENIANLPAYVCYLYNEAPSSCHGSRDAVNAWLEKFARIRHQEAEAKS